MKLKRILLLSLALILALSLASPALAYSRPDLSQKTSLKLHYHQGDLNFENVEFKLYKIAEMTELVKFEVVERFAEYPVEFQSEMTAKQWTNLAEQLAGYVARDKLAPDYTGKTDADGVYELDNLGASLYLVIGASHQREYYDGNVLHRVYYHAAPFLISTPSLDSNGKWLYDVTISPKFDASEDQFISKRLLKIWDDEGYEDIRPRSVKFDLLCDGQVYDTIELNSRNSWRYQWDELDNSHVWRIVERNDYANWRDYFVTGRQEGMTYVITNGFKYPDNNPGRPEKPDDKNPGDPDVKDPFKPSDPGDTDPVTPVPPVENIPDNKVPTTDKPNIPENPENPGGPDYTPDFNWPKLPQTGQLWWPVPVLAVAGSLSFLLGWLLRRRNKSTEE